MKKISLVLLLALVALTALTAQDNRAVVLKFTDFQAGNDGLLKSYQEMAAIFEKAHPNVKIDYQQYGAPTYNEFLKPAIASGKGPDLMAVFPGPDLTDIGKAGALRDLTKDIDPEWKKWLGPAYDFSGLRYEGKLLIVPQDVWTEALWYYKDMLKSIGVDAAKMKGVPTVQDFIDMVKPAKAKGLNVVTAGFVESLVRVRLFLQLRPPAAEGSFRRHRAAGLRRQGVLEAGHLPQRHQRLRQAERRGRLEQGFPEPGLPGPGAGQVAQSRRASSSTRRPTGSRAR